MTSRRWFFEVSGDIYAGMHEQDTLVLLVRTRKNTDGFVFDLDKNCVYRCQQLYLKN